MKLEEVAITISQLEKMRHCIGLDLNHQPVKRGRGMRPKFHSWRNYYVTGREEDKDLKRLQELEIVASHKFGENGTVYTITQNGFEFLSQLLEITIIQEE